MSVSVSTDKPRTIFVIFEEHMQVIEEKSGMNAKLMLSLLAAACSFVFIGYFDNYITNVIGILYPAFWSIRAIESKETDDDKQWLTYWVVFSLFSIIDLFSGFVLKIIPFYFFIKMIFLIWLFMPNTKGATFIYDKLLIRVFKQYEDKLENVVNKLSSGVDSAVDQGKNYVKDNQSKIISSGMNLTNNVINAANDLKKDQ